MKKTFLALAAVSLMGIGLMGCEGDEDTACISDGDCGIGLVCDTVGGFCAQPNCGTTAYCAEGYCVESAGACSLEPVPACGEGEELVMGNSGIGVCQSAGGGDDVTPEPTTPQYTLVRVDDMSDVTNQTTKDDPGADIDAIGLYKDSTKSTSWAKEVRKFERDKIIAADPDHKTAGDPTKILGAPDAFVKYPNQTKNDFCNYRNAPASSGGEYTFVSLGGGYIEVEMTEAIEAGDKLIVFELGKCKLNNLEDPDSHILAGAEEMKVQVAIAPESGEPTWREVGTYMADKDNFGIIEQVVSGAILQ